VNAAPFLEIRDLTKRFGFLVANEGISFSVSPGEIHALVGENGAGKSTLMKCLYGLYRPDGGEIRLRGRPVSVDSPRRAAELGIGMVHQHFMLLPSFPVYRNVVLGAEPRRAGGVFDEEASLRRAEELAGRFGVEIDVRKPVGSLPVGLQQRVEILKLLHRQADLLIFDEPTAVLSPAEADTLLALLRGFAAQGKTVLFIAHKLSEVLAVADRITVLRKGRKVGTLRREEADEKILAGMMVGHELSLPESPEPSEPGPPLLEVRSLCVRGDRGIWALRDVELEVRRGEIVGIAGVTGNGQSELEEAIFGLRAIGAGEIRLGGLPIGRLPVRARREAGMAYIPEDRLRTALAALGTLEQNALMGFQTRKDRNRRGILRRGAIRAEAERILREYDVKAPGPDVQAGTLSGGNMQRLVLAREMAHGVPFLLVSQPTRGVDVGGIAFLRRKILDHRAGGGGTLLISSDLDEVMALSDRVLVLSGGRIVARFARGEASRERIGEAMLRGR